MNELRYNARRVLLFLVLSLLSSTAFFAQSYMQSPMVRRSVSSASRDLNTQTTKFKQALYLVANGYLDSTNMESLTESAIKKVIADLDPHSSYISAKDVAAMEEPLVGNFNGIGIEYALINDTLTVQSVVAGGPSERMGLRAGDKINKVDGETISGTNLTTQRVIKYLRGPRGSKVRIGYLRRGVGENEVVITRDVIPVNTVDCSYRFADGIIYIRISRFGAQTYKEFMGILSNLTNGKFEQDNSFKGLILDLRGNGGGYLSAAQKIANEFLSKGELILYSEGRAVSRVNDYADGTGRLQNIPLSILIDESSASASEIVSGAVQDQDRGYIVGRRSFGKGLVQQEYPLVDGSRIRLTIARYHTPSGRVIQTPYKEGNIEEYQQNYIDRILSDERFNRDSIKVDKSLKFKTLKLGRTVYGGGGIIPDEFIPIDTSYYSRSYLKSVNTGAFTEFVQSYSDLNRAKIEKEYSSYEDFLRRYSVPDNLFSSYLKDSRLREIVYSEEELRRSKQEIIRQLKGLIIRNIYGLENYLKYSNLTDKDVQKAKELLMR